MNRPAGIRPAPADHSTAIAALLVGRPELDGFAGLLSGADLYAARVFRQRDRRSVDATAE